MRRGNGAPTFLPAYEEAVKLAPNDRILVETDAPYLSPEPVRGGEKVSVSVGGRSGVPADQAGNPSRSGTRSTEATNLKPLLTLPQAIGERERCRPERLDSARKQLSLNMSCAANR